MSNSVNEKKTKLLYDYDPHSSMIVDQCWTREEAEIEPCCCLMVGDWGRTMVHRSSPQLINIHSKSQPMVLQTLWNQCHLSTPRTDTCACICMLHTYCTYL